MLQVLKEEFLNRCREELKQLEVSEYNAHDLYQKIYPIVREYSYVYNIKESELWKIFNTAYKNGDI